MNKKILVFAGSTSKKSINKQLASYAATKLVKVSYDVADLNDYVAPLFSIDEEEDKGFPESVQKFNELLDQYDGFIVSLAEHNGSYAAAFKNIFDWVSRIDRKVFRDKPLLLMSTSPGGRGGASVLETANSTFPHLGGNIVTTFSLPNFYDNFKDKIIDEDLRIILNKAILTFEKSI
ncbi:MAG: NAD(P)H-dependent oxidoreductase [Flavobacteriaceae bacterium]|nr:NAD(P)H-dependent oxidoreductase [Flavobacteriaceae bacterium]